MVFRSDGFTGECQQLPSLSRRYAGAGSRSRRSPTWPLSGVCGCCPVRPWVAHHVISSVARGSRVTERPGAVIGRSSAGERQRTTPAAARRPAPKPQQRREKNETDDDPAHDDDRRRGGD